MSRKSNFGSSAVLCKNCSELVYSLFCPYCEQPVGNKKSRRHEAFLFDSVDPEDEDFVNQDFDEEEDYDADEEDNLQISSSSSYSSLDFGIDRDDSLTILNVDELFGTEEDSESTDEDNF